MRSSKTAGRPSLSQNETIYLHIFGYCYPRSGEHINYPHYLLNKVLLYQDMTDVPPTFGLGAPDIIQLESVRVTSSSLGRQVIERVLDLQEPPREMGREETSLRQLS